MISVQQLTKIYGTQKAVDNISFEVVKGEVVGFLGPNGAGKSTTMKIASAYLPATSGTVIVAGFDVANHSLEVRKRLGYLPEHNPLYLDMYVHEFLRFSGGIFQLRGQNLKNRVAEVIERTGLTKEQNKRIGALSKGYRQRVGLAQTLIHDPEVLILDEPTTGLDPNQIVEIRQLIKDIGREKTVILSTHIMQEVQAICQRAVIINNGSIVADATIDQLTKGKERASYQLELAAPIDLRLLLGIAGVLDAKKTGSQTYTLVSEASQDIRAAVFDWAKDNNLTLLGMTRQVQSLEQIFQQLTQKS